MNSLTIGTSDLFKICNELFDLGLTVRITITGTSMYPFLYHLRDSVELNRITFEQARVGDIVLAVNSHNKYLLHRIHKKTENTFFMIGDNQRWLDGPYTAEQLIARADVIYRKGKRFEMSSFKMKFFSRLWMSVVPFRRVIVTIYKFFLKIFRKKPSK